MILLLDLGNTRVKWGMLGRDGRIVETGGGVHAGVEGDRWLEALPEAREGAGSPSWWPPSS